MSQKHLGCVIERQRFVVTDHPFGAPIDGGRETVFGYADTLDGARNIAEGKRLAAIWNTLTGECLEVSEYTSEADGKCCLDFAFPR